MSDETNNEAATATRSSGTVIVMGLLGIVLVGAGVYGYFELIDTFQLVKTLFLC